MPNSRLALVLHANALSSMLTGLALVLLAGPLAPYVGLGPMFLRVSGLALVPFALFVFALARQERPSRRLVALVSAMDFAWVVASLAVVFAMPLTTLGNVLVLAVAVVVELFGTLQLVYARRGERALATV